ncbi:ATP-binding protein [Streptomyces sp. Rer75]|uniref:ATP-binding protein n=1 Tax=unclassified Streptomyces TaxID=2593676 RepID=UPI0015D05F85|nr:ATP-binding protein [Streptomyces sp. Rer75]QLH23625.1 AAA family ATPase [Streptomyces sp. Rer75]
MTHRDSHSPGSLGEHLRAARQRAFVGRDRELARFRAAIDGAADAFTVLFLTGPGGIGKSSLLRRFADEAHAAGLTAVELDGRSGECSPTAFEADAAEVFAADRPVLLVDTFEEYQSLEGWLRDRFLPRLPLGSLVVLAGRQPPSDRWRTDPGWEGILRVVSLPELPRGEAVALLAARGVPPERQAGVLAFAGGNPLALSLAAEVARDPDDGNGAWAPAQDVIGTLVSRLVGEVPSAVHRQALEICAHAHMTTEELLRAALPETDPAARPGTDTAARPGADAAALFAWLRGLPFIETGPCGIFPHDVVRETLDADLRWRDPQRYRAMHGRILSHLVAQVQQARGDSGAPGGSVGSGSAAGAALRGLSAAVLYLQRDGFGSNWFGAPRPHEVYEDTLRPGDRAAVLELAAKEGPEENVAIVRHWLDRQPESFHVYRRSVSGETVGFMSWLRLTEARAADQDADPVIAAAWAHARRTAPPGAGEHLGIARFTVRADPNPSPAGDLMSARIMAEVLTGDGLAWALVVMDNFETYQRSAFVADLDAPPLVRVGDRLYGLFGHDQRKVSPDAFLQQTMQLDPGHGDAQAPPAGPAAGPVAPGPPERAQGTLSRAEFDAAVRSALRSWHRPDALSASPLLHTGLVAPDAADPVETLRDVLAEAAGKLRADRLGEKLHQAVAMTFFEGAPTQEAAAARLGVPFSTYRRHLTRGVARVCELLWHR